MTEATKTPGYQSEITVTPEWGRPEQIKVGLTTICTVTLTAFILAAWVHPVFTTIWLAILFGVGAGWGGLGLRYWKREFAKREALVVGRAWTAVDEATAEYWLASDEQFDLRLVTKRATDTPEIQTPQPVCRDNDDGTWTISFGTVARVRRRDAAGAYSILQGVINASKPPVQTTKAGATGDSEQAADGSAAGETTADE